MDTELDLEVQRVIRAPRDRVWRAWTDPARFERWWVPAPARCRVEAMELVPGGAFRTLISTDDGAFVPHMDACVLAVDDGARLLFTDALTGGWRPSSQPFMTAEITLADHPDGTAYRAMAMHRDRTDRDTHESLGFLDGWGTVVAQLADLVESS
nr:SRPBCC family protein [Pseudonocardia endophytica]